MQDRRNVINLGGDKLMWHCTSHSAYNATSPELYGVTLISLINVEPTLTDFEKFHPPQNKNPPSSFIDFINKVSDIIAEPDDNFSHDHFEL